MASIGAIEVETLALLRINICTMYIALLTLWVIELVCDIGASLPKTDNFCGECSLINICMCADLYINAVDRLC